MIIKQLVIVFTALLKVCPPIWMYISSSVTSKDLAFYMHPQIFIPSTVPDHNWYWIKCSLYHNYITTDVIYLMFFGNFVIYLIGLIINSTFLVHTAAYFPPTGIWTNESRLKGQSLEDQSLNYPFSTATYFHRRQILYHNSGPSTLLTNMRLRWSIWVNHIFSTLSYILP